MEIEEREREREQHKRQHQCREKKKEREKLKVGLERWTSVSSVREEIERLSGAARGR